MYKFILAVSVCLTLSCFCSASQRLEAFQQTQVVTAQSDQTAAFQFAYYGSEPKTRLDDTIIARNYCLRVPNFDFSAIRVPAAPEGGTEKLLKDAKLDYKKVEAGVFKLVIESKGISVIHVEEKKAAWKDNKKNDVLYAYIYTEVLSTPKDFKPPVAMLLRIAELNDHIQFGSLSLAKNQDGSYTLFRNGTIFLKNLEGEQLLTMVYITHNDKLLLQKEFREFVEVGQ